MSLLPLFPGLCPRSFVDIAFVLCFVTSFVLVPFVHWSPAALVFVPPQPLVTVCDCIGSFVPLAAPSQSVRSGSIYDYITSDLDEQ